MTIPCDNVIAAKGIGNVFETIDLVKIYPHEITILHSVLHENSRKLLAKGTRLRRNKILSLDFGYSMIWFSI